MLNTLYDNWLMTEINTTVKNVIEEGDRYYISLKETPFYVKGGGMDSDRGTINGHEVQELRYIDGEIYHLIDTKIEGDVVAKVDRDYRIMKTQIHSAQHLMCGIINKKYNAKTIAFFNDDKEAGAEMGFEHLNDEIIQEIEELCNHYIREDLHIEIIYPTKEEALQFVNEEKLEHDELRAVKIGDIDYNMCACIHIPSLRYLQLLKIERYEKTTRGYRIYFLCGEQFFKTYDMQYQTLKSAAQKLSSPVYEVDKAIDHLNDELKKAKSYLDLYKNQFYEEIAKRYITLDDNYLVEVIDDIGPKELSKIVNFINNSSDKVMIFIGLNGDRMHVIISHSKKYDINAKEVFNELAEIYNLKGGGNAFMAQGGGLKNLNIVEKAREMLNKKLA